MSHIWASEVLCQQFTTSLCPKCWCFVKTENLLLLQPALPAACLSRAASMRWQREEKLATTEPHITSEPHTHMPHNIAEPHITLSFCNLNRFGRMGWLCWQKVLYKCASSTLYSGKKSFMNCFLAVNQDYHLHRIHAWRDLISHTAHTVTLQSSSSLRHFACQKCVRIYIYIFHLSKPGKWIRLQ